MTAPASKSARAGKADVKCAPIGVHFTSIAGGVSRAVERAVELNCGAVQIFSRNPRSWRFGPMGEKEAELFRALRMEAGISPVVVHATYLINLASPDEEIFTKSVGLFKKELRRAEELGAEYFVTHLGSPRGKGPEYALERIKTALRLIAATERGVKTEILFENTAGGGTTFGSRLEEVGEVVRFSLREGLNAGLCLDTCHAFAAGYRMDTDGAVDALFKEFERTIGPGRLRLVHLNDSKGALGSRLDRHEHLGGGMIGAAGLGRVLNHPAVKGVPIILETPKKDAADDLRNLAVARKLRRKT